MRPRRKGDYSKEQIDYLRKIGHRTDRTNKEITEMFNTRFNENKSITAIIGTKSRHGIRSFTRKYTEGQIRYLKSISPGKSHKEITKEFNKKYSDRRTETSVKSIMQEKGIKLSDDGRFKKGNSPSNTLPTGTEILRSDGYLYVKIKEPNLWKAKHHIVWEEKNGPIPEDHIVLFGDGNQLNFDIDNLILISRAKLLQLNRYDLIGDDAELTKTGLIIADIYHIIGEKSKKRRD